MSRTRTSTGVFSSLDGRLGHGGTYEELIRSFPRLSGCVGPASPTIDLVCIFSAFVSAYYARFHLDAVTRFFPPADGIIPDVSPYFLVASLAALTWVLLIWKDRGYEESFPGTGTADRCLSALKNGCWVMAGVLAVSFLYRYLLLSRLVYLMAFASAMPLLVLNRAVLERVFVGMNRAKEGFDRVLVMRWRPGPVDMLGRLGQLSPSLRVVGLLNPFPGAAAHGSIPEQIPTLGFETEIEAVYRRMPFSYVLVGNSPSDNEAESRPLRDAFVHVLNFCESKGILMFTAPASEKSAVREQEIGLLLGMPVILLRDASIHPLYALVKRCLDIVGSLAVLVLGAPMWALIAAVIKMDSRGPVFYSEERAGLHGEPFTIYKFRSMVENADAKLKEMVDFDRLEEPVFNIRQDPRVTRAGRLLRRASLDEIPQFWNVLLGNMSIVGPRPDRVELVERYDPLQRRRLKAKPGITGYQQVVSRGDPSLANRIELDLAYMKNQSFLFDAYIILKTLLVVARGDGLS
ncbi:MAG: exopolysaccharide biosynthesis polyprenyl glycosylphosphotransferase [Pseudomonadota bacterium]